MQLERVNRYMNILNKEKLKELINELKEIPGDQITIVYKNDECDGPLEGICKWKEKEYYFIWYGGMNEEKDEIIRKFLLIELTDNQIKEEKRECSRFVELSQCGKLEEFYKEKESYPEVNIDRQQTIGWFAD